MDSSLSLRHHTKDVTKQCDSDIFVPGKYPSSRRSRTTSFSSSSSSFSPSSSSLESYVFHDDPLLSPPASPLIRFSGVPFSWEHLPGIPKKHNSKKKQLDSKSSSIKLLPLPPPTITNTHPSKKNSIQRDPFFAALVECSKDDREETSSNNFWNEAKVSRSISDRFGFINLYGSCKRTCAVSQSLVYLPTSRRSNYEHVDVTRR